MGVKTQGLSAAELVAFAAAVDDGIGVPDDGSRYGGSAHRVGAHAMGPLLLGFSLWLLRAARSRNIAALHFLARDGHVMKAAYELVASHVEGAPRATYVLASRRAALVSAMRTPDDVASCLEHGFGTARVGDLFAEKLGFDLARVDRGRLEAHGLAIDARITPRDHARVRSLVAALTPEILASAASERDVYRRYLASLGVSGGANEAVVDIGYSGSMQRALDALVGGGTELGGFYLVTVEGAKRELADRGYPVASYLGEYVDRLSRGHAFFRQVAMFESFFSSDTTSFVKVEARGDDFAPVFQAPPPGEARRVEVVREVHRGALAFVAHAAQSMGARCADAELAPALATAEADAFFARPHARDARIFSGVPFENAFGAADVVSLVPETNSPADTPAMWEEGRCALLRERHARDRKAAPGVADRVFHALVDAIAMRALPPNKAAKLLYEPSLFFADARSPVLRRVGRRYLRVVRPA